MIYLSTVSTTVEPSSLCEVTKFEAQSGGLLGSFIPQCSEEGLFSRLQCHGSTGYCWCVDELTGEEIGNSAAAERFVKPDCDGEWGFFSYFRVALFALFCILPTLKC